jgi:hypothetical protein
MRIDPRFIPETPEDCATENFEPIVCKNDGKDSHGFRGRKAKSKSDHIRKSGKCNTSFYDDEE